MVAANATFVGKCALYHIIPGFEVWVHVLDVREVFGRKDFEVAPYEGRGSRWVSAAALNFTNKEEME